MRLHVLQHVPFEDPATIATWARDRGHSLSHTHLYRDEHFPLPEHFDWLFILGGPMCAADDDRYPWLTREKRFIEQAIAADKVIIGICLGAQLIAAVLGGTVYRNRYPEIGWFPVRLTAAADQSPAFHSFPKTFSAFHWHGDTFSIPDDCTRIAASAGCRNQAFEYNGKVIGLQFHLESVAESIQQLIRHCTEDLTDGKYIQSPIEMRGRSRQLKKIKRLMALFLDNLERNFGVDVE
jgi:GMP synthase (glutamine-hydrolysing)